MQPESPMMAQPGTTTIALAQNRVLRNTYLLLAISMLPTIARRMDRRGNGFSFFAGNPVIGMVLFLAIAFGFMFAINKTKDSAIGVAVLLAFTFFMGLMLSGLLGAVLRHADGAHLIALRVRRHGGGVRDDGHARIHDQRDLGHGPHHRQGAADAGWMRSRSCSSACSSPGAPRHRDLPPSCCNLQRIANDGGPTHHGYARVVPGHLQRVPELAGVAGDW